MSLLVVLISLLAGWASWFQPGPTEPPALLLVDADHNPQVSIGWTTAEGEERLYEADRPWGADIERTPLGGNIAAYAAVGGTRLALGAGHPKGAVIRFGFYKIDAGASFFDDIAAEGVVRVEMRGVRFNQPARPIARSMLQHLKFAREALVSCRIASNAWSLYNTADPAETLGGRARIGYDLRPGALAGGPGLGRATARVEPDGSITVAAEIPYALFKHIRDPWKHAIPGTFLEPVHFHVEVEVLPQGVPERNESLGD
jgi:hypothetical protein